MTRSVLLTMIFALAGSWPAIAGPEHIETLRTECARQLGLPEAGCNCIADKAAALNDEQQAFVAATIASDKATSAALRGQMSVADLTAAGEFMTSAPAACARG